MGNEKTVGAADVRRVMTADEFFNAFKSYFCKILDNYHWVNAKSYREKLQKFWLETQAENYNWKNSFTNYPRRYLFFPRSKIAFENNNGHLVKDVSEFIWAHQRYFEAVVFKFFYQIETKLHYKLKNDKLTDKQRRITENRLATVDDCMAYFLERMNYMTLIRCVFGWECDENEIKEAIKQADDQWFNSLFSY